MWLGWQRRVLARQLPLLCQFCKPCWTSQRGCLPLYLHRPGKVDLGLLIWPGAIFVYLCACYHRELAFQISEQVEALGASIGVKCGEHFYTNVILDNVFPACYNVPILYWFVYSKCKIFGTCSTSEKKKISWAQEQGYQYSAVFLSCCPVHLTLYRHPPQEYRVRQSYSLFSCCSGWHWHDDTSSCAGQETTYCNR